MRTEYEKLREMGKSCHSKHSLKHRRQNTLGSCDWLSLLPDPLLLHILSFLPIEDVIRTSLLSRRWRYLWMFVPSIDFRCRPYYKADKTIVAFMDRLLLYHEAMKVQKFCIQFCYRDEYADNVDSWIHTMLRRNVEELYLDFFHSCCPYYLHEKALYKLPRSFFHCRSLITLSLRSCDLNLPSSVCLSSLKTLCLCKFELTSDMLKNLIFGCPLLEELMLKNCNTNSDLIILAAHPHLKRLKIHDVYVDLGYEINIHAPGLLMLEYSGCLKRRNYDCIKTLKSLESAKFECEEYDWCLDTTHENYCFLYPKLLGYLHVKDLKLDSWFIQALSVMEVLNSSAQHITATRMEMKTGLKKWELPGIAYLLKNSPSLGTLTVSIKPSEKIKLDDFQKKYDFDERKYWKLKFFSLQNLKKVIIHNFMGGDEYLDCGQSAGKFVRDHDNEFQFVKFLLKNVVALQIMIVKTSREDTFRELAKKEPLLLKITQRILSFPRASPNVRLWVS